MEFGPYSRNKQTNEQTSMNQSTARSTLGWRSTTLLNGTYGLRQTAILPMTSGHNGQAGQDDVKPSGICRLLFLVICQCSLQVSYVHATVFLLQSFERLPHLPLYADERLFNHRCSHHSAYTHCLVNKRSK